MEEEVWAKRLLGDEDPKKLLATVYYLVAKHFGVRTRAHHRELTWGSSSQIKLVGEGTADEHFEYEDVILRAGKMGRVCKRFMRKTGGKCCPVAILKKYTSLIPKTSSNFYNKPLSRPRPVNWYIDQPIGVNKFTVL